MENWGLEANTFKNFRGPCKPAPLRPPIAAVRPWIKAGNSGLDAFRSPPIFVLRARQEITAPFGRGPETRSADTEPGPKGTPQGAVAANRHLGRARITSHIVGGPPGPRPTPSSACSAFCGRLIGLFRQRDEGVPREPGIRPTNSAGFQLWERHPVCSYS
jgi:hypothetical protein